MTVESLITQHIDTWTSAVKTKSTTGRGSSKKLELYGVKKLRELILELAVRGKLVPQDPNDEPASVLLQRIAAERFSEVKNGKLKKIKQISDFEYPCELPINWSFVRLEEIIQISSGKNLTAKKMDSSGNIPVYGGNGITGFHSEGNVSNKTIVIGRVGFYCGSIHLTPSNAWVTDNAFITKYSHANIDEGFLVWLLKATNLSENDSATAQPVISGKKVYPIVVALPPKKEQQFIAAKIDELMTLCDQLEQQTEASIEAHQLLVSTLLNTLTNSADADELMENWARISNHFDTLFTTEESIDQLKQTILQLAVMGKLVPQDPNDEPASVLLERLNIERNSWLLELSGIDNECKTMLRKLKKLGQPKSPFPLPKTWACTHLIELSRLLVDCHNKTAPYVDSGIPIIRTTNIRERKFVNKDLKYVNQETYEYWSRRCPPQHGDIMFTREAPMGEALIIPEGSKWCLGQRTMLIRPMHDYVSNEFLLLALTEPHLLERASEHAVGLTVKHLRVGDVENLNVPIPPLREQYEIVAKVNELMAICEQFKQRLKESQATQLHLTDAIVEQAV
ncbi:TPA: restriction endonuclease subunit S [Photobacterium damselae]